jgi:RNA polymerase sigma factor (sigma-70 family)
LQRGGAASPLPSPSFCWLNQADWGALKHFALLDTSCCMDDIHPALGIFNTRSQDGKVVLRVHIRQSRVQPMSNPADCADFAALAPMHLPTMLRVAAALVGVADAEDAAQEALMRAWQGWPGLRDAAAFRPWLLRITVNVCRDWQRGRFGASRRLLEPFDVSEAAGLTAAIGSDPGASDHTAALDLRAAIARLEPEYRVIVALRYYVGLDATEVGTALGLPSATVRTRLRRALTLLREHLSASGDASSFQSRKGDS